MNQKLCLPILTASLSLGSVLEAEPTAQPVVPSDTMSGYQLQGVNQIDRLMNTQSSLRPFITDRGGDSGVTAGQGNVDIGWMSSYSFRNQTSVGSMSSSFSDQFRIGLPVIDIGLLNNLDLRFKLPSYDVNETLDKSPFGRDFTRDTGFTDFSLGLKYSLLAGKDGYGWIPLGTGALAWSIAGDVTFATASEAIEPRDNYRGGLQSELGYYFPCGWQVRMDNGFTVSENDRGCWDACFCDDLYVHTPQIVSLHASAYVGFESVVPTSPRRDWEGHVNIGAIYVATPSLQFFA